MGKTSRRKRQARSPGPHSGQILGAVVNALDVGEGVLADKTSKRMFAGRSVSEYSRKERLVALAQALVDLGIVPDVDDRLRKGKFRDGLTTADIVADVIGVTCDVWDWLMEGLQSKSVEVTDFGGAGRRYLRLVTVDVALRMVVLARLAQMELPEPHVPVWAQPNGSSEVLRGFQAGARPNSGSAGRAAGGAAYDARQLAGWQSGAWAGPFADVGSRVVAG